MLHPKLVSSTFALHQAASLVCPCTRCWGGTQPEVASWFLHTPAKELGVSGSHSVIKVKCPGIAIWWQKWVICCDLNWVFVMKRQTLIFWTLG